MFQLLDIIIALGIVYLILSMVHKYLMSMIKRAGRMKAKIIDREMRAFIGENMLRYLIPYLYHKEETLNFFDDRCCKRMFKRLFPKDDKLMRKVQKKQILDAVEGLEVYLNGKTPEEIREQIGYNISMEQIRKDFEDSDGILKQVRILRNRIAYRYDYALDRISEMYESKIRVSTFIWGLVLALFINADFFYIFDSLSKHTLTREKLAAQVELINDQASVMITHMEMKQEEETGEFKDEVQHVANDIKNFTGKFDEAGLKLGWTRKKIEESVSPDNLFNKVLGIFISGLLISFGAPFWHDMLCAMSGINKILREKRKTLAKDRDEEAAQDQLVG